MRQTCGSGWVQLQIGFGATAALVCWRRTHLRRRLPDGGEAANPPTGEQLLAELHSPTCNDVASGAAAAAPQPPRAGELQIAADSCCVVVLLDTERYEPLIHDLAATALVRVQTPGGAPGDSHWVVPAGALGRYSAKAERCLSFDHVEGLVQLLESLADAICVGPSGKAPEVVMLAHGGPNNDWPSLVGLLKACGLALPPCVAGLGCSRHLFVAEKADEVGAFWNMSRVFEVRFGGSIEDVHTAVGDVRCVMSGKACT